MSTSPDADGPPGLVLLGAGGHAREIRSYLPPDVRVWHAVDEAHLDARADDVVDVARPPAALLRTPMVAAVGAPYLRRQLVEAWPGQVVGQVVAPQSWQARGVDLAAGCVLAPQSAVGTGSTLGRHTHVNVGASVAHDCRLGEHVTVSPGARLGGGARLGDGVFVGIGATVLDHVTLADGVVVGAGAVVVHDVAVENAVVVGIPARQHAVREGWLRVV